jgi:hypothetical protein
MLEKFIQRKKRDLVSGLLYATIIMGAIAMVFLGGALASLPHSTHTHFDVVKFVFCALVFGIIAFLVIRDWARIPKRIEVQRKWFLEAAAEKERLEKEFADIKTLILIGPQGSDPNTREIAMRSLNWAWHTVVHNKNVLDGGCSELLLKKKDHTF